MVGEKSISHLIIDRPPAQLRAFWGSISLDLFGYGLWMEPISLFYLQSKWSRPIDMFCDVWYDPTTVIGPVYHGTRADFQQYDRDAGGGFNYGRPDLKSGGIFFTPFPCLASRFAMGFDVMMELTGANIRIEYLNVTNTLYLYPDSNPTKDIYVQMLLLAQAEMDGYDSVGIYDEWGRLVEWVVFKPEVIYGRKS